MGTSDQTARRQMRAFLSVCCICFAPLLCHAQRDAARDLAVTNAAADAACGEIEIGGIGCDKLKGLVSLGAGKIDNVMKAYDSYMGGSSSTRGSDKAALQSLSKKYAKSSRAEQDSWVNQELSGRVGSGKGHQSYTAPVKKDKAAPTGGNCGPNGMTQKPEKGSQSQATKLCIAAGCPKGSMGKKHGWKCKK